MGWAGSMNQKNNTCLQNVIENLKLSDGFGDPGTDRNNIQTGI